MTKRVYKQETLPCRNLRIQTGKILVKIWLLLRGVHEKPIYRGDCLKAGGGGRFGQFVDLMGLGKKVGGRVFLSGGVITQCTLCYQFDYFNSLTPVVY